MKHSHHLELIRDIVSKAFVEYCGAEVEFCETMLIRDGFYCGRCFTCETIRAVWFAEESLVKFYGEEGQFIESRQLNADTDAVWRQRAA